MNITLDDIAYKIAEMIRGELGNDMEISLREIKDEIHSVRAKLLSQQLSKQNFYIDDIWCQKLLSQNLEPVTSYINWNNLLTGHTYNLSTHTLTMTTVGISSYNTSFTGNFSIQCEINSPGTIILGLDSNINTSIPTYGIGIQSGLTYYSPSSSAGVGVVLNDGDLIRIKKYFNTSLSSYTISFSYNSGAGWVTIYTHTGADDTALYPIIRNNSSITQTCVNAIYATNLIYKTVNKIPKTISRSTHLGTYKRVSNTDEPSSKINIVTKERALKSGNGRFNSNNVYGYESDNYLYLFSKSRLDLFTIDIEAVFENPSDVAVFSDINGNSLYSDSTTEYPISRKMEIDIQEIIYNKYVRQSADSGTDKINDSNEDLQ